MDMDYIVQESRFGFQDSEGIADNNCFSEDSDEYVLGCGFKGFQDEQDKADAVAAFVYYRLMGGDSFMTLLPGY